MQIDVGSFLTRTGSCQKPERNVPCCVLEGLEPVRLKVKRPAKKTVDVFK